jgi:tetratricopeptide (TPR) repeat protein
VGIAPHSALALCNRGTCLAKTGEEEAALQDFDAALEIDGRNEDCLMARGAMNKKLGRLAEAVHDFSRVIELQSTNAKAYVNRAMVYERADDLQAAMADCRRALDIDAHCAKAHFCLGVCLERAGDDEAALVAMSRAVDLERNVAYFNARGMLHEKVGQFDLCIEDFNKAISLDPTNDALVHNRGAPSRQRCGRKLMVDRLLLSEKRQI